MKCPNIPEMIDRGGGRERESANAGYCVMQVCMSICVIREELRGMCEDR